MASLRKLKKDIDFLVEEIVSDSYLTIYFHPEKKDSVVEIMQKAVSLRNDLYQRANNPVEKNNPHLVRKHYMQIRLDMMNGVDQLFTDLSEVNK
ncbi:MAG: hypothetical protein LIO77_11400 [Rikenellaceae bacterium]|nr:hypothetical protein [Rikenellaceae bacterium]